MCKDSVENTRVFLTGWFHQIKESIENVQKKSGAAWRRLCLQKNQLRLQRQKIIVNEVREMLRRKFCVSKRILNSKHIKEKIRRRTEKTANNVQQYLQTNKGAQHIETQPAGRVSGTL